MAFLVGFVFFVGASMRPQFVLAVLFSICVFLEGSICTCGLLGDLLFFWKPQFALAAFFGIAVFSWGPQFALAVFLVLRFFLGSDSIKTCSTALQIPPMDSNAFRCA